MNKIESTRFFPISPECKTPTTISIEMAGEENCLPNYYIKRQHASISVLCYVISGKGVVHSANRQYHITDHDVFILEKNIYQEYYVDPNNPWSCLWFNIHGDLFPILLKQYHLQDTIRFPCASSSVAALFKHGIDYCKDSNTTEVAQEHLSLLIIQILMKLSNEFRQAETTLSDNAQKIKKYLDRQVDTAPHSSFSYKDMTDKLLLSAKQLTRISKQELHCTPYDYFMNAKVSLAKNYLRSTSMSIKEISYNLGFCDPYYFSNFFKQKVGISPSRYKLDL